MDEIRCEIEIRQDDTRQSPGRVFGELITYEKRASDRPERFTSGALHWAANGIILDEQHNRQASIMRFQPYLDELRLMIDAPLPDTQRGRDAATSIANGTFTGLSIQFRAQEETRESGVRVIKRALLRRAALVDSPSYEGSLELRESEETETPTIILPGALTLWL